jgi:hypothetical protein
MCGLEGHGSQAGQRRAIGIDHRLFHLPYFRGLPNDSTHENSDTLYLTFSTKADPGQFPELSILSANSAAALTLA